MPAAEWTYNVKPRYKTDWIACRHRGWAGRTGLVFAWGMVCALNVPSSVADMPNIVLLMASGQRAGMAGFEGNPQVKTPHLDRLAAEAVVFPRTYAPSPYRQQNVASVATGLYPHAHGAVADGVYLLPGTDTVVARLRRAGYTCGLVGQWGVGGREQADPVEGLFDHAATCVGDCPWQDSEVVINGDKGKVDGSLADWITEQATGFLTAARDKPSFLWVTFRGPRPPFAGAAEGATTVAAGDLPLPESMAYEREGLPGVLSNAEPSRQFLAMNEQQLREARAAYATAIMQLDASVGRILQAVEQQGGPGRPTVVVWASDGGFLLGEHRLYGTGAFFYDELIRVPLVIRCPALVKEGVRVERVVSLVDLGPTLLGLAGQPVPPTMHGRSLVPVLQNPRTRLHADECFLVYEQQDGPLSARGLISRHYKYVSYTDVGDILYDLARDPLELYNVSSIPEYQTVVRVLGDRLDAWRKATRDPRWREEPTMGFAIPPFFR